MSNDGYGSIRQTNQSFFNGLYIGCDKNSGISFPDFEKVANAFGITYRCCKKSSDVEESIKWLFKEKGAAVLEVYQRIDDPTTPKLMSKLKPDGTFETPALQDLEPFVPDDLMKELMPDWK